MELKNKKTGKIIIGYEINRELETYDSIRKFCEEWEDYEEPKAFIYIDDTGCWQTITKNQLSKNELLAMEEIGNVFSTEEEAELAVEKLKAWKRLKDNGFRFIELRVPKNAKTNVITIKAKCNWRSNIEDLDLLFGGEE